MSSPRPSAFNNGGAPAKAPPQPKAAGAPAAGPTNGKAPSSALQPPPRTGLSSAEEKTYPSVPKFSAPAPRGKNADAHQKLLAKFGHFHTLESATATELEETAKLVAFLDDVEPLEAVEWRLGGIVTVGFCSFCCARRVDGSDEHFQG